MPFGDVISRFNGLNHRLARWPYALAAAVGCIVVAASLASNLGVCIAQGRILSSEDYFKAAIDVVIHDPVDGVVEEVPGFIIHKAVRSQRYSDPNEFLGDFPQCCAFVAANSGDGGPEISVLDRLSGVRTVEVSYEKRYADDQGVKKSAKAKAKVAVTACGTGRFFR